MKHLLIATKNQDKLNIICALIDKLAPSKFIFSDLKSAEIDCEIEETGSILERSEQKAREVFGILSEKQKQQFWAVLGIDDGFDLKQDGPGDPDSKTFAHALLVGKAASIGETIWIKRGFALCNRSGMQSIMTALPFRYVGNPNGVSAKEDGYPLAKVLTPIVGNVLHSQMSKTDLVDYYEKYLGESLSKLLSL
ncbi:hypothetical protein H6758_04990 [Candidatus Nomurabacteria bacterium]|nr:hypothetical protein [Candidatus Nomurabacteria bacterium]